MINNSSTKGLLSAIVIIAIILYIEIKSKTQLNL